MLSKSGDRAFQVAIWCAVIVAALVISAYAVLSSTLSADNLVASPPDGDLAVPITAPVRIVFSAPMEQSSVEVRFHIEPPVDGELTWDDRGLVFLPRPALAPATTYTITLEAGSRSRRGTELTESHRWSFRTRDPRVLFLSRQEPDVNARQLFITPVLGDSQALTDHAYGVWDYAPHPLGEEIVYSALREDGGADLWRVDSDGKNAALLVACPGLACINPVWSPDGSRFVFEKRDIWASAPNLDPKAGRLWLWEPEGKGERPLYDYDVPAHSAAWSPDGSHLAYVSPLLPGFEVYDPETQELQSFPNEWGAAPEWSADSRALVVPELILAGEALVVRLFRVDLEKGAVTDISGDDDLVKDVGPAWSPAGGWIVYSRQYLDQERWTPGRQLWLTRPDGLEAYSLVTDPVGDLFGAAWRPDAGAVVYLRTDLSEGPQAAPSVSVWLLDLDSRTPVQVAGDGVLPRWLP